MIKFINKLLVKWYFPISLKYISLIAYIILITVGLMANATDAAFLKQLRNTNLGNLIVWSYWWPAIIILAIFFGRIWCMICPVEIITSFFAKIGFKKKRPDWILSGWAITIFYIMILMIGIQGIAIHRNPLFMSIYLLIIVAVSVIIGSIYEKNTFCRYFCPVGYLLGLYSRLSFFGWRVKSSSTCNFCSDKSCINKDYLYHLNYKSCGLDLYPAKIDENSDCILCAGCLKTCNKFQSEKNNNRPNPQLTYIGFAKNLFKLKSLKMAEMAFVVVISGFVISEIWSEWSITDKLLNYFPEIISKYFDPHNSFAAGIIKGFIIFGIIPLLLWLLPFSVSKIFGSTLKIKDYFLNYGISFIPIIAAAHLCKAILKTTSRIPYFKYLSDDYTGITTAQKIVSGEIVIDQIPFVINLLVSMLITLIIPIGIWLSIKVVIQLNQNHGSEISNKPYFLIPIVYGAIFLIMILSWRWLL